jgi:hypothetical protein
MRWLNSLMDSYKVKINTSVQEHKNKQKKDKN